MLSSLSKSSLSGAPPAEQPPWITTISTNPIAVMASHVSTAPTQSDSQSPAPPAQNEPANLQAPTPATVEHGNPGAALSSPYTRRPMPCELCRQMRKKCNLKNPCSRCEKKGLVCEYAGAKRRRFSNENEASDMPELPFGAPSTSSIAPPPKSHSVMSIASLVEDSTNSKGKPLPCQFCRSQKKRCDMKRPSCSACTHRRISCIYMAATGIALATERDMQSPSEDRSRGLESPQSSVTSPLAFPRLTIPGPPPSHPRPNEHQEVKTEVTSSNLT
ncbi:hypothetical protein BC830DRAFT_1174126 [Chytriomyces sp. MP71]|nr:hypothetical protein BC830DRAFT_1174126 [Chytriomyces sp. MP71]